MLNFMFFVNGFLLFYGIGISIFYRLDWKKIKTLKEDLDTSERILRTKERALEEIRQEFADGKWEAT